MRDRHLRAEDQEIMEELQLLMDSLNRYYDQILVQNGLPKAEAEAESVDENAWLSQVCPLLRKEPRLLVNKMDSEWGAAQWLKALRDWLLKSPLPVPAFLYDRVRNNSGFCDFLREILNPAALAIDADDALRRNAPEELAPLDLLVFGIELAARAEKDGVGDFSQQITAIYHACEDTNDLLMEKVAEYFTSGEHVQTVIDLLKMSVPPDQKRYYLMQAMVMMKTRNDSMFRALKRAFKEEVDASADKLLAASMLGEYGDSRAIPVLRTYMQAVARRYAQLQEQRRGREEKEDPEMHETFHNMLTLGTIIHRLGGETDDICSIPF